MEKFYNNINLVRSIVNKMNFGYLDKDDCGIFQISPLAFHSIYRSFLIRNEAYQQLSDRKSVV